MDEQEFLRSATPAERSIYDRLNAQQRAAFLQSLAPAPRTSVTNPAFQEYLSQQDEGMRSSFSELSPQEQEEAARMILLRQNQGVTYTGESQPRQYPDVPYLTSAGSEAGFRPPISLPDFGAAFDLFSSGDSPAEAEPLQSGLLGEGQPDGGLQIAAGGILSTTPEQYRGIIADARPDSYFLNDDYGNPMVQFDGPGGDRPLYYMGGPFEGAANLVGQGAMFMGGARLGSGLFGRGMLARTAGAGAADAAMSVGMDLAAEQLGSEEGVDAVRALLAGGVGAGAELVTPLVTSLANRIGQAVRNSSGNALSPDMVAELRRAGVDPNNITGDLIERIRFYIERGENPADAVVRAGSDRYGIPLTRGEAMPLDSASRPIAMQREYSMGSSAAYGTRAADTMNSFRNEQRSGILGSRDRIASEVGIDPTMDTGGGLLGSITRDADELSRAADAAYEAADRAGVRIAGEAFHREGYDVGEDIMARALDNRGGLAFAEDSGVNQLRDRINALQGDVTFTEIENVRQSINRFIRNNVGNSDRMAAGQDVLRAFDDWADEALDGYVLTGSSPEAIQLYREARDLWRDLRQQFTVNPRRSTRFGREGTDVGGQLIQDIVQDRVRPEDIGARVFGGSRGFGGRNSNTIIDRLVDTFGSDHPAVEALRGEAFGRMFEGLDNPNLSQTYVGDIASGIVRSIDDAFNNNASTMSRLFTEEQATAMREYADTLRRLIPPPNAINRSNSGYATLSGFSEATREFLRRIPGVLGTIPERFLAPISMRLARLGNPAASAVYAGRSPTFPTTGRGLLSGAAVPLVLNEDQMESLTGYNAGLLSAVR